jgi:hypothetical protein
LVEIDGFSTFGHSVNRPLLWQFEVYHMTFALTYEHDLHLRATRENFEFFCFMTISIMAQNFDSCQLCHDMFCGWQISHSQNIGYFLRNLDEVGHSQSCSLRATWGHFGRFLIFHGASNMCTNVFQIHVVKLYTKLSHCPTRKNPTQIGHQMSKILAPKFGSYIWAAHPLNFR